MSTFDIPWKRYALIAELAKRLDGVSPQFGKTSLVKLVFLLQEAYGVDMGYDFELYSYGPFAAQLLSDLDLVDHWGGVAVESVNASLGGYRIRPTDRTDAIRHRASDFLDDPKTSGALDELVSTYGRMTARDLELRATTLYVERDLRRKNSASRQAVCKLVGSIKPKFSQAEIERAVDELQTSQQIQLAA
jgi:hypothetical protein